MSIEIQLSSDVLVRDRQGEAVLLDLKSQKYFGLDEVGTVIWNLLCEHSRLETVKERLLEEFDVESSRLENDLQRFLHQLETAELITVVGRGETEVSPADLAANEMAP